MLKIKRFVFSLFDVNTYLLIDESTKKAAVIDPAMYNEAENKRFDDYIKQEGVVVEQIINTHLHLDHCFGENFVKNQYGVPAKAHLNDMPLGQNIASQYAMFGMNGAGKEVTVDVPLNEGDTITIGDSTLSVIHVPGHSPGGIALYYKEGNTVLVGDSLFRGSIGRTDLYGNHSQLINSIKTKLLTLPPQTVVLPGHGPSTTIAAEKNSNPFLQ